MGWLYLGIAIIFEVIGTTFLKRAEGNVFSNSGLLMFAAYGVSFALLTLAIKNKIEIGVGYAVWSGVGIALISVIGMIMFNEHRSVMKFLCISMIILGVIGLRLDQPQAAADPQKKDAAPVVDDTENIEDPANTVDPDEPETTGNDEGLQ